ncbi:MAG: hypothetical protein K2X29_01415 [Candidatus Obscuribacterales bacterium]|nr:hypothetical protein [Candidatus Obscuribacterales bacterium]
MYSQTNNPGRFAAAASSRQSGDAVRLAVGDGQWMSMQQAVIVTGLHERTLRRYIKNGGVKSRKTGNRTNSKVELWITPEISKVTEQESEIPEAIHVFNAAPDEDDVSVEPEVITEADIQDRPSGGSSPSDIELVMRSITGQFLERLDQSNEVINQLKGELEDKERQLRLLPDLQKKADEAKELAELKSIALEKQIEELQSLNEKLKAEADEAKQKATLAQQKKSWWRWFTGTESS